MTATVVLGDAVCCECGRRANRHDARSSWCSPECETRTVARRARSLRTPASGPTRCPCHGAWTIRGACPLGSSS